MDGRAVVLGGGWVGRGGWIGWIGWMTALGCIGLGCDAPAGGGSEKAAEVVAKAEGERAPSGEAAREVKAAGGAAKDVKPGTASEPGASVEPGKASEPGPVVAPDVPLVPGAAVPSTPSLPGVAVAPGTPSQPGAAAPGTPAAPGAIEPVPPSPALPALSGTTPSEAAFSEKMQRRLRSKLREQHDARTQLASSLALPQPDGGVVVLALYEYSEFEACVGKSDGSAEARKECANRTDDNERVLAGLRKCTGRGLVRASFGPAPKSQPEYGGELTVETTRPLAGGCTVMEVRRFALEDADGDGQPELALDVIGKTPQTSFRSETPYDVFTRTVGWYRTDLSPQYESRLCDWFRESLEEGSESIARRIRLADEDGDGRKDLIVDAVSYVNDGDCDLDEVGWLKTIGRDDSCVGEVETTTWRYDAEDDAWIEPPASSPR